MKDPTARNPVVPFHPVPPCRQVFFGSSVLYAFAALRTMCNWLHIRPSSVIRRIPDRPSGDVWLYDLDRLPLLPLVRINHD